MQLAIGARREAEDRARSPADSRFRVVRAHSAIATVPCKDWTRTRRQHAPNLDARRHRSGARCALRRSIRGWRRCAPLPARCRCGCSEPGFASLASIIVSQQVSRASADAIFGRLTRLVDPLTPEALLAAGDGVFREAGLSRPKQRAVARRRRRRCATASTSTTCARSTPQEAIGAMTAVPGIGPWTARCLPAVRRRPSRRLPRARRRAADGGRPCARHRAASGREGADRDRRIMVAVAGRRVAAVLGLLSRNQGQGGRAAALNRSKKARNP